VISADVPEPATACPTRVFDDSVAAEVVSTLPAPTDLAHQHQAGTDAAVVHGHPTRIAPLCPAPSSTTEQPYSVGGIVCRLGWQWWTTPGRGARWG